MRTLCSDVFLIDLRSSWHSVSQFPTSTLISVSSSFRRTRSVHKSIASLKSPDPSMWSPEIRRPSDRFPFGNGLGFSSPSIASTFQSTADAELEGFLELVPLRMRRELYKHEELGKLIEVVMDLGRKPIARFPSGDWIISEEPITAEDLGHAISKVGDFSDDNRSGIDSSLHRISAIRNRKKQIIGLTCRVGRALSGSADTFRDLVASGGSILVVGPPGVGKTTMIREIARMLADEHRKRVIIVDTSNEIGGDGDVPHAGIGRARRMQVPNVHMQHNVMIEAVENHMPQTIIIDEIGTELEALAASTIAQRGVQLVGTAHGITIDNIIKNPCLQNLVGGIESVTLGDEEARKRKVQKTILERKGPPTFTCAVEMISKTECRVHHHLDASVDAILAGKTPMVEVRHMNSEIQDLPRSIELEKITVEETEQTTNSDLISNLTDKKNLIESDVEDVDYPRPKSRRLKTKQSVSKRRSIELEKITVEETEQTTSSDLISNLTDKKNLIESDNEDVDYPRPKSRRLKTKQSVSKRSRPISVYIYEILEVELLEVATVMGLGDVIDATDDIAAADAIVACSSEIKENPWIRGIAKLHQLPVFVIKSNTMAQMVKAIRMMLGIESYSSKLKQPATKKFSDVEIEDDAPERKPSLEEIDALEEVRLAIEYIVIPGGEPVELLPRRSDIVARQLELVESYQLEVENSGTESNPRLQILPLRRTKKASSFIMQKETAASEMLTGGGATTVARLPLLPE